MFGFDDDDETLGSRITSESQVELAGPRVDIEQCSNSALAALCVTLTLLVFASGCGRSSKPWERVYAASGKVKFAGYPLGGAQLTFFPRDKSIPATVRPTATTEIDGSFELGTYSVDDGAPAGEYDVVVTWSPLVNAGDSVTPGPNRLPVRYSSPESSQLKVKIDANESSIPALELAP
ncbi:MAG: hypothetical protein JWM11_887 [Planctomycetaceae bacterium]|nr:hypothetical protein [Planctomycetaceae bacterium]